MLFRLALTHRTQTQLSHALPYLSVHLSLPALPLSALRQVNLLSTYMTTTTALLAPVCHYYYFFLHRFQPAERAENSVTQRSGSV